MTALATLLLATPLFGFSLHAPVADAPARLELAMTSSMSSAPSVGASGAAARASVSPMLAAALAADAADAEGGGGGGNSAAAEKQYREETKRRNELAKQHRLLGLSTWVAMTATVVLGTIQYHNLYGFFADQGSNPCVTGDAIFGQGQCYGTPWPHLIAASVTTALYATTFTISLMMPDPDDLSSGKGEFAKTLRMHKLLRWVHFSGMVAQLLLGAVIANDMFGLDRANDYGKLRTLSTIHLATGYITYGALTWAGALMTF